MEDIISSVKVPKMKHNLKELTENEAISEASTRCEETWGNIFSNRINCLIIQRKECLNPHACPIRMLWNCSGEHYRYNLRCIILKLQVESQESNKPLTKRQPKGNTTSHLECKMHSLLLGYTLSKAMLKHAKNRWHGFTS